MNTWEVKKLAIVEADDFQDRYDRNGLNFLLYWKTKYPKFKISLFTIPDRTSDNMIKTISLLNSLDVLNPWIELLIHGFNHESNYECYGWDEQRTKDLMERVLRNPEYKKIFKAPGWTITPNFNGYPAGENDPLKADPLQVYRALTSMGFTIFDRHYNKPVREDNLNIVCVDDQPDLVHMHTWNVPAAGPERNGFGDVEELQGVPWDQNTEFKLVSEALEEGLFKPCQK